MKQIKFRLWNGHQMETNIMAGFLGNFFVQGMDENDAASMSPFNTKYPDGIETMQFTGLCDKNGKEIYEGDVVKYNFNCPESSDEYTEEVYFSAGIFCIEGDIPLNVANEIAEVVGNIYENPTLRSNDAG